MNQNPIVPFVHEELSSAVQSLCKNKLTSPDGIPAEVHEIIFEANPRILLNMYNDCLFNGTFSFALKANPISLGMFVAASDLSP